MWHCVSLLLLVWLPLWCAGFASVHVWVTRSFSSTYSINYVRNFLNGVGGSLHTYPLSPPMAIVTPNMSVSPYSLIYGLCLGGVVAWARSQWVLWWQRLGVEHTGGLVSANQRCSARHRGVMGGGASPAPASASSAGHPSFFTSDGPLPHASLDLSHRQPISILLRHFFHSPASHHIQTIDSILQ